MSKKGSFFTMLTGIQATVLLVVLMVVFGFIFIFLSAKVNLTENKYFPSEDLRLINYLRTPITIDNEKTNLGDFIILADSNSTKRYLVTNEINKFISLDLDEKTSDIIKITFSDNSKIELPLEGATLVNTIYLPTLNSDKNIIVELYKNKKAKQLPSISPSSPGIIPRAPLPLPSQSRETA